MYKKILVPLDGSPLAEVALPYAEELAGKLGSEIVLLHVSKSEKQRYDLLPDMYYIEKTIESAKHGAQKCLGDLVATDIKVESVILIGYPAEVIVEYADMKDVDLIIMATHGRSGIKRWALGSVADKVVRATDKPVALIRAKDAHDDVSEKGGLDRILVLLDGSETSEAVIPHVRELGSKLKTEIILLRTVERVDHVYAADMAVAHVPYTDEEMEPLMRGAGDYLVKVGNLLEGSGINPRTEVKIGDAAAEIIKFADEVNADLVAMSTHGRSGISRWNLGSVASKVLHAGSTPLLLVRTNAVLPDSDQ